MQSRPGSFDPSITRAAAEALADDLAAHSGEPREVIIAALIRAMDVDDDAEAVESNLETEGWRLDEKQRAVVKRAWSERLHAHTEAVEQWVIAVSPRPIFAVGDGIQGVCEIPRRHAAGPILRIVAKWAQYVVDSAGRERSINFEDARPFP